MSSPDNSDKSKSVVDLYDKDYDFWDNYIEGRPQVPDSFFERILAYHSQHSNCFALAHDAGAGAAVHSYAFADEFAKVIVSDISASNIYVAKTRWGDTDHFTYRVGRLQDTAEDIAAGSVDLFFVSTAIHFCGDEVGKAIEEAARQLKSGGTIAVSAFGPAIFDDPEVQRIWLKLYQQSGHVHVASRPGGNLLLDPWKIGASSYDAVPLPVELFEPGALRIKLNFNMTPGFTWRELHTPPEDADLLPEWSQVGPDDQMSFESDSGWRFEWEETQLRMHKHSMRFPNDEQVSKLWLEMVELVKSRGTVKGVWPAIILLATRR
ncbi:Methyltransferase gedG [Fulvia fulva]|uniref:Methyltransferase gedG n=1 Tax=Passalora fulva TaxID=5499 RepID=A0A9Q8LGG4_PASFU|nr:Methyltransferase gedG [Fulvia fulva]KAK4626381.1 Methyltransferase gedG [Fulvia fulva]KAK4627393.1 Methyltransferase gedG [Fulvia fulva]UJO16719.1 Methyltransferase gedG [Fulvia fulva]WPV13280.1 Methyltransferase gedG [Fulvia fulva]WPV29332.1 Methyltransferase gedG [Fulvia fulva]